MFVVLLQSPDVNWTFAAPDEGPDLRSCVSFHLEYFRNINQTQRFLTRVLDFYVFMSEYNTEGIDNIFL